MEQALAQFFQQHSEGQFEEADQEKLTQAFNSIFETFDHNSEELKQVFGEKDHYNIYVLNGENENSDTELESEEDETQSASSGDDSSDGDHEEKMNISSITNALSRAFQNLERSLGIDGNSEFEDIGENESNEDQTEDSVVSNDEDSEKPQGIVFHHPDGHIENIPMNEGIMDMLKTMFSKRPELKREDFVREEFPVVDSFVPDQPIPQKYQDLVHALMILNEKSESEHFLCDELHGNTSIISVEIYHLIIRMLLYIYHVKPRTDDDWESEYTKWKIYCYGISMAEVVDELTNEKMVPILEDMNVVFGSCGKSRGYFSMTEEQLIPLCTTNNQ
jgi:hypothetical protein